MSWGSFHHTLETHEDPREARIHAQEGAHNRRKCPAHCASRLLPHESCPEGGGGGAAPEHGAFAPPQRAMSPQGTDMRARVTRARRETRLQRLTWGMQVPRGVRKWASHTREKSGPGRIHAASYPRGGTRVPPASRQRRQSRHADRPPKLRTCTARPRPVAGFQPPPCPRSTPPPPLRCHEGGERQIARGLGGREAARVVVTALLQPAADLTLHTPIFASA